MTQAGRKLEKVRQIAIAGQRIVSFAIDGEGEIYVVGFDGIVYQLDLASAAFD